MKARTRVALVGHVDHGKSTLIGRLLADTGQTQVERQSRVQSFCESTGRKFEFAFLLDALEEEQAQGITLDVTEVHVRLAEGEFLFVDTPGHREFLKKMVGGASRVEAAVLILDVSEKIQDTLRRQMMVLDLLGVRRRIIVINKMDLVDWSEQAWRAREAEIRQLLPPGSQAEIIPASAWHGENLLTRSTKMPWYSGPTFAEALAAIDQDERADLGPARFFVQDVYRFDGQEIYAGRVESGIIHVNDSLTFSPGGQTGIVGGIEVFEEKRERAAKGDAVGIVLKEPLSLDRGALGFCSGVEPLQAKNIVGDLFWLDSEPLKLGDRLKVRTGTSQATAIVQSIEHEIDGETFLKREHANSVALFGRVQFQFDRHFAFDRFETCEPTGRFVVSRGEFVLGGGRWVGEGRPEGRVLWFTGLSGAGKSTLARALEKTLREKGEKAIVLDGDELRSGLCRDLGFSPADRRENLRRAAELAKFLAHAGFTVISAFITPLAEHREFARKIVGESRFKEVFIDCPLEICEKRDVKGLYAKARRGELADFTGISAPFEAPKHPDIHLRTGAGSIESALQPLVDLF